MIRGKATNEHTTYYALSVTPAHDFTGAMTTVYLSNNSQAIENLRDQLIANEDVNHTHGPNVYQVANVTIPDELRRTMADQNIERSVFGAPVRMPATGMLVQHSDVVVGKDYFHGPSQWMMKGHNGLRDVVTGVRTEMQVRDQVLQPFADSAAKTNPYKMLDADDLARPETKAAMTMAFTGQGVSPALYPAVAMMAKNGLDTAEMVPEFQKEYERQLEVVNQTHPGVGRHEWQNEALMNAAWTFQTERCGNDMRQQGVFQFIAGQARNAREQCATLDLHERTEAFGYAGDQVQQYMQNFGQYLTAEQRGDFGMSVNLRVGELQRHAEPTQKALQGVIQEVAQEFAQQAREAGRHQEAFNYSNIADAAHDNIEALERAENEGLDERFED